MSEINKRGIHTRILESKAPFIVSYMGRRSGKSFLALDWLIKDDNTTSMLINPFLSSNPVSIYTQMIQVVRPELEVVSQKRNVIELSNGCKIHFLMPKALETGQGKKVDKIAIDNAEFVRKESCVNVIMHSLQGAQILCLGGLNDDSLMSYMSEREKVHIEKYDYRTMIKDDLVSETQMKLTKEVMGEIRFKEEFGPWEIITRKNKNFIERLVPKEEV